MPPRPTFKGFLRLSLVSVPVKGFTASASSGGEIRLNQLHRECNSRIKYQKMCPTHGEVTNDDIVSGYEYSKDQYVIVDPEEVQKIRKESDKTVDIKGFIPAADIDPLYFSGRTYYFVPDGPAGQKPYQLLREAMESRELFAVASAILSGREQMVAIRPIGKLLGMSILQYHSKVKKSSEFEEEIKETKVTKEEAALTKTLIDASLLESFDFSQFTDHFVEQLEEIIEKKVAGEEIVAAPEPEEPKIINLMDALKASVENAKQATGVKKSASKASSKAKMKTKMAPSSRQRTTTKRKRKSG